jgi:hypothetical protein
MNGNRTAFFLMVDGTPVHPLVSWARDEIVRLENLLNEKAIAEAGAAKPRKIGSKVTTHDTSGGSLDP